MKHLGLGLYLLIVFVILFPFVVLPRIIKVNKLECYSQYGFCGEEIFILINKASGKSIKEAKDYISQQIKNNGTIQKYAFAFKLPGTLRIDVILNKAKFALYKKDTSEIVLLDKEGNVLEKIDKTNLPKVVVTDPLPSVGEKVSDDKLFLLNLVYNLNFLYQVNFGEVVDNSFTVRLPDGPQVYFPLSGDAETLLGSLKLILSQVNFSGQDRGIIVVDLRFKNPIIRK